MTTNRPPQSSRAAAVFFQLTLAIVVSLTLVRLISISERYPYYFMWDLDHTADIDTLLINSGFLPDSFGHPGFGMYLMLTKAERAAHRIGALSFATLDDVEAALDPMSGMAELADFLRRWSPYVCVAIVLALWTALRLRFALPHWCDLLCLLLLASQPSLSYQASMIRGEQYSMLFWSISVLTAAMVASATKPATSNLGHLIVGAALGLAFLTKVQAVFYVAETFCLLMLFRSFVGAAADGNGGADSASPEMSRGRLLALAGIVSLSALFFIVTAAAAVRTHIPTGVSTFATSQGVTPIAVVVGILIGAQLITYGLALAGRRVPFVALSYAPILTALTAGFFLAFALHFLAFADRWTSWLYLVYDFKIVFMRQAFAGPTASGFVSTASAFVAQNPAPYICHVALLIGLGIGRRVGEIRVSLEQMVWSGLASLLAVINLGLAARFILRDLVWAETVVNLLSLVYLAIIVTRTRADRRFAVLAASALVATAVVANGVRSAEMVRRIDANYNLYGWQPEKWASAVYGYNQERYSAIIARKYDSADLSLSLRAALDHRTVRNTAEFVLPSLSPDFRHIGRAAVHLPVWVHQPTFVISKVPAGLSGAMVIDASAAANRGWPLYQAEMVRGWSEYLDKFRTSRSINVLPVMTRPDLRILLFVAARDVAAFMSEFVTTTGEIITLRSGGETMEMIGLEVKNYSEIPFTDQPGRYFFVVVRR